VAAKRHHKAAPITPAVSFIRRGRPGRWGTHPIYAPGRVRDPRAVLSLLALDCAGAQVECFAPNVEFETVDHLKGKPSGERRNALVESARMARGKVRDVAT
jgi:hypothetical protein